MEVTAKKTVTTFTLAVITILIVITIYPMPLPFIANHVRNQLDNSFHVYHVDFEKLRTRWRPIDGVIELHLTSVQAMDYGNNNLANVPKVIIEVIASSAFKDRSKLQTVELYNPKISLIRSHVGAVKFDVGNTQDSSSGKILETILTHLASVPSKKSEHVIAQTSLRIINSDLTLSDEVSGSLLRAPNANIDLHSSDKGVECDYNFNIFASGEYINIFGDCLYDTTADDFTLSINLDKVRPALLTEFSPQFAYFTPLEVQLSGNIQLHLDSSFNASEVAFDLKSENGTLEVIEILGSNIDINSLHIVGKALNGFSHIEIDRLSITLDDKNLEANALFLKNRNTLDIKLNTFIQGNYVSNILPRWFAYLESEDSNCVKDIDDSYRNLFLSIDGTYDYEQERIDALGHFKCHVVLLSSNLKNHSLDKYQGIRNNNDFNFSVHGTLHSPNLVMTQ
jgi:hypothetical protein